MTLCLTQHGKLRLEFKKIAFSVLYPKHHRYSIYFTFTQSQMLKEVLVLKEHFVPKKMKDILGFYDYYFSIDIMICYNHGMGQKNMQILC